MAAGRDSPESRATSSGALKLEFGRDLSFQTELNRRVEAYFAGTGEGGGAGGRGRRKRDCGEVYLKSFCILIAFAVVYGLLVFAARQLWQGLLLTSLLGLVVAAIGFNIQHEGGHRAYSQRLWVNRLAAFTMDLIGSSSYRWHWKHAVIHHRYVNITGYDGDMYMGPLGRLAPHQARYWYHRWQHLYLWGIYALLAVKIQFIDDIRFLLTGRLDEHRVPRPAGAALLTLLLGRLLFFTWAFVCPLLFHPLLTVLFFYLVGALVAGMALVLVFMIPHLQAEAEFPLPRPLPRAGEWGVETPWAVHQALVTVNFARGNRVLTWLLGGLNYHKEHHLFPLISHANYPGMSAVVERTCRDFGLPYKCYPTFAAGVAAHYRWLRRLGKAD